MKNRYGFDFLSQILIFVGAILCFWKITLGVGIVLVAISLYRVFSKDTFKRRNEARIFEGLVNGIYSKLSGKKNSYYRKDNDFILGIKKNFNELKKSFNYWIYEKQNYKIVKCPKCKQKLRLPRGRGKIVVTCKKCSYEFKMKT